ncbi:MAG: shikimate dehydrogenase family protein [Ilumatobacteraceae bacterium]
MPSDPLLEALRQVVTNDLPQSLPSRLAFIVGSNPSKGARSPKLWGAAFAALGLDGAMFPLDVTADKIGALLSILEADKRVVGVAVAAPYKADFAALLGDRLSAAAKHCGSVNLLSRDSRGRLHGSNTDGIGAVESLREVLPNFAETQVLVLGCGGTGRAVIATLVSDMKPANVTVAVRGTKHTKWLAGLGVAMCDADLRGINLGQFGVVVNCTTVGWGDQVTSSPLSRDQISALRADCTVFDVVYQPDPTLLLEYAQQCGLQTLSGTRMNLLQAVIAFSIANDGPNFVSVTNAMKHAASR